MQTRMPNRIRITVSLALAFLFGVPSLARSAHRDELLHLVPDDISLCFVVNDLREHGRKFFQSDTFKNLRDSALGQTLLTSPELQPLLAFDAELQRHFKVSWQQIQNDILGDCIVFAFQHGGQDPPRERGLILLWAKEPRLLANLIEKLNEVQIQNQEITSIKKRTYRGVTYRQRVEAKGKHQFYVLDGALFVFSNDEDMLKKAIDRQGRSKKANQSAAVLESFQRLKHSSALLTFWLNPRAFDGELQKKAQQGGDENKQVLSTFGRYWRAIDACAVSVAVDPEINVFMSLQGHSDKLPAAGRKLIEEMAQPSAVAGRFPANAAVYFISRVNSSAALEFLEEFMTPKTRAEFRSTLQKNLGSLMGRDFVKDVLPFLGPDVGFFVAAGESFPHALLALRVQPGPNKTPVDQAIINTVQVHVGLAVLGHNLKSDDHIAIKTLPQSSGEIKYLQYAQFPKGFRPAFGLKDGFLVLATSPEAINRFTKSAASNDNRPLMRLSLRETSKLLRQHRDDVVRLLTQQPLIEKAAARRWVDDFASALQTLDRLELDQQISNGQVTWRLRLLAGKTQAK